MKEKSEVKAKVFNDTFKLEAVEILEERSRELFRKRTCQDVY